MSATFEWCWDVVVAAQRSSGWDPPALFVMAEVADRFGHVPPVDASTFTAGELEAWVCTLVRSGVPLAWRCRDAGPPERVSLAVGSLLRRVVVADAMFPHGVLQHRWVLSAVVGADGDSRRWVVSPARRTFRPWSTVAAVQRWVAPDEVASPSVPLSVFGVCTAALFDDGTVACFDGAAAAAHVAELVDVPVVSRCMASFTETDPPQ